jgi:hypothetical protein
MDVQWWDKYIGEAREKFAGLKCSSSNMAKRHGITFIGKMNCDWSPLGNSGAGCAALAAAWGCSKIILLGYDCQRTNGMAHWHGDHPRGLGNAGSMGRWGGQFQRLAQKWGKHADIVNCSRATALTSFRRASLEEELGVKPQVSA